MSNKIEIQVGDYVLYEVVHGLPAHIVMLYAARVEKKDGDTMWIVQPMSGSNSIGISTSRIREVLDGKGHAQKLHEYLFNSNTQLISSLSNARAVYLKDVTAKAQEYRDKIGAI